LDHFQMFKEHRLLLFLAASLLLAVALGRGIFYVLARSLARGKREGILSSLGTFVGGLFHVFAADLGLASTRLPPRGMTVRLELLYSGALWQDDRNRWY